MLQTTLSGFSLRYLNRHLRFIPFIGLAHATSQYFPARRHVTQRLSDCQVEAAKSD